MRLFGRLLGPPSKHKFARMLMDGIRRAGEPEAIQYDPHAFSLSKPDRGILNLGNAYTEYCGASKEDRQKVIGKWVRGWFVAEKDMPEDYEDVRPDLLPAVRGRGHFDVTQLRMQVSGRPEVGWPYQPIGEHLAVGLVYDMHEAMRSIRQEDLDAWGLSFYEALEVAKENLMQLPQKFIGPEEGTGVYLSANSDNYDASRLLLLDVIHQFNLNGDPVAMAPTRDSLIVAGEDDVEALEGMLSLARDAIRKQPGLVSTVALRLSRGEWEPWLPERSHPLHNEFKMMEVGALTEDYRAQKGLLDKLHEARGEDLFVAVYTGLQNENTGDVTTYAVWARGITSWLPQTDILAFMRDPNDKPRMFAWDRVVEVAGDLMEPLDVYPPRFSVSEFPTDVQFAAMGQEVAL